MSDFPISLLHALQPWVQNEPQRTAVVFRDLRLSYGELAGYACALAQTLQARGVRPGDRVAGLMTPRPEALIAYLATWLAGATFVGVTSRFHGREQAQILKDSGANVLLSVRYDGARDLGADLASHEEALGTQVVRFGRDFWEGDLPQPVSAETAQVVWSDALRALDPDVPAVIIYTSGSTGTPKGAMVTHAGLAFRSHTLHVDRFALPHIRQLVDIPVNHIGALASGIGLSFVAGGMLVLAERFDPAYTLATIAAERLDVLSGVPAMLTLLIEHPDFSDTDFSSVKFVNWGAGPLGAHVLDALLAAVAGDFSQQYGMTESNGPIVYTPPTRDREILLNTTGRPDPRLELRIAGAQDTALPPGSEGEVQVRQPYPFAGYLGLPEATEAAFTHDGFLRTGDLARIRDDGYLVFCGRSKEMYKSGGFNVYPREIEILLESHPGIRAAAVLAVDDPAWGQVGHAFIEAMQPLTTDAVLDWCRQGLANYKVPKTVSMIDAMPRTSVDKVDRQALARLLAGA